MKAVLRGDIRLVDSILKSGNDSSSVDTDGSSALIYLMLQFEAGEGGKSVQS